jgi:LTXXQ motif family protein
VSALASEDKAIHPRQHEIFDIHLRFRSIRHRLRRIFEDGAFSPMRKALIPMLASLALCGAATTAMVISSANAQPGPHKPMMVAMTAPDTELAANDSPPDGAPPGDPRRDLRQQAPGDMAARMKLMCQDLYARQSGRLAYLEAKLNLTAAEQPLFLRWKDATLGVARRQADQCAPRPQRQGTAQGRQPAQQGQTRANRTMPSPADRMAREEDRLKERLADIQAERPALEVFYNALSPEQKMELARGERGDDRRGMMRHSRFAEAMGPRGPMGQRPMMGPPGPPDGPGAPHPER